MPSLGLILTSVAESVLRVDLNDVRLERKGRDVLVVDQVDLFNRIGIQLVKRPKTLSQKVDALGVTHLVELDAALDDLVSDGAGIGEGGNILANLVEREGKVVGKGTTKLSLGLLAKNDDSRALGALCRASGLTKLLELGLGALGDRGVDTTAKTLVGGDNDEELTATLGGDGLGVLEDLC